VDKYGFNEAVGKLQADISNYELSILSFGRFGSLKNIDTTINVVI